ncbi:MAG TPA: zonular occludens toxin domain-containing protein [Ktedonobacteraceae bacterium]|nr:zonular occludens toxin domain-containing protein [Ktedonobacteraceae bacterium]
MSQFAVHGAEKLTMLGDLLHERYRGAAVCIDEIGRILPARDWSREDEIETALLETHRHHGLEIRYACQDLMQASAALRRLTEWYIYCIRCGPDPSRILKAGKNPSWWQCPLAVRQIWVRREDVDAEGFPKPFDKCVGVKVKYAFWHRHIAKMYDTTERIYPGLLQDQIEQHLSDATERIATNEPWSVQDGHSVGTLTRLYRGRDEKNERKQKASRRADTDVQKAVAAILQGGSKGKGASSGGTIPEAEGGGGGYPSGPDLSA